MDLLNPERFMVDDERMEQDYERIRGMAPASARTIGEQIEDICDRMEYEGSFLFDESPDQETLYSFTDKIYENLQDMENPSLKDYIQALLLDEILYRRCRYYRKKKMFE